MSVQQKINCWDYMKCEHGPESGDPCPAAVDEISNGVNSGTKAGRICWTISDTLCFSVPMGQFSEKRATCLTCDFFDLVRREEGFDFHQFKLAQGVRETRELHSTVSNMEHLIDIMNRLHSHFDLYKALEDITDEARKITGAQRSVVFLIKGDPPALSGEFTLRGKKTAVTINIDNTSAVGYAAAHSQVVNLRDVYKSTETDQYRVFNKTFDIQCNCKTHSLIAVPVQDSERRVIGVITAANAKKGYFSADDEWFMRTYATEVALAVEKQRFFQQSLSALKLASIGETVAGLSHCIKNIAQALRGSSYIIKRAIDSDNVRDIKVAWEILDRHIENLAKLSLDVLSYDPSAPKGMEGGGLNEMVRHVVELFQEEAKARAMTIRANFAQGVDPCSFDTRGIYRCLVNLVTNALDACPLSDGRVVVSTARSGEKELMVSVSDNGRGMDERQRAEVFELFKTTKPGRGSGIGLPTVVDIIRKNEGRIEIDSKPGKGTTIAIHFRELARE